jgi:hypothetical protein
MYVQLTRPLFSQPISPAVTSFCFSDGTLSVVVLVVLWCHGRSVGEPVKCKDG